MTAAERTQIQKLLDKLLSGNIGDKKNLRAQIYYIVHFSVATVSKVGAEIFVNFHLDAGKVPLLPYRGQIVAHMTAYHPYAPPVYFVLQSSGGLLSFLKIGAYHGSLPDTFDDVFCKGGISNAQKSNTETAVNHLWLRIYPVHKGDVYLCKLNTDRLRII